MTADAPNDPRRLDLALVDRGLARSRTQAQTLISGGEVQVRGRVVTKPATPVLTTDQIVVATSERWVGRAAYKLMGAFDVFGPQGLTAEGLRCLDVGASTGGFTQVLLHQGAAEVVALDVGRGQLASTVAKDPRVVERSGTTVRGLAPAAIGGEVALAVADLSFISLTLVMAELAGFLCPAGQAVVLVKPQFEVGRDRLGHSGVVRSASERARALRSVAASVREHGLWVLGMEPSPILGGTGNHEYLLWLANSPDRAWGWEAVHSRARQIADDPQEKPT